MVRDKAKFVKKLKHGDQYCEKHDRLRNSSYTLIGVDGGGVRHDTECRECMNERNTGLHDE